MRLSNRFLCLLSIAAFISIVSTDERLFAGKSPLFTLERIDGGSYDLSEDLGKNVILLEFWGTCCKSNIGKLSYIETLQTSFGAKGLKVFAINVDDASARSRVKPTIRKYGYSFPILLDPTQDVLRKFSPSRIKPCSVIIGKDGQIATVLEGENANNDTLITETITRLME